MKTTIITLTLASALFTTPASAWDTKEVSKYAKHSAAPLARFAVDGVTLDTAREVAVSMAVKAASIPATVGGASSLGMTASTGTAIASLSGAAAVSATLAAVGTPVIAVVSTVVTITAAPAVVGGAVVAGAAFGVAWGINSLIDLF